MSTLAQRRIETAGPPMPTKSELIATKRAIALGKLTEFERQCERLAKLVVEGRISRTDAVDGLFEAAQANHLTEVHSVEYIQLSLAAAFISSKVAPACKGNST